MVKKPPPRPNLILGKIPPAKRRQIEAVCAKHGTSIERIPAWMLTLAPRNIDYRLKLFGVRGTTRPKVSASPPGLGAPKQLKPSPKVGKQLKPSPLPRARPAKKTEKKAGTKTETGRAKIPNTLTGQNAIFWLRHVVPRVVNVNKRERMRNLIYDNVHLPLDEFKRQVVSKIDEMLTTKKKPE